MHNSLILNVIPLAGIKVVKHRLKLDLEDKQSSATPRKRLQLLVQKPKGSTCIGTYTLDA